ncbi:MAG TPA: recombinase family protein [Chitinophagales bacterium]|nr:recombinase family protein [Chitinophagales bacterium]
MSLEKFKSFGKKIEVIKHTNNEVWIYTRVSSKDQESNKSLTTQLEAGHKLAKEKNFIVTNTFGGTYESASGDISRTEFMKLMGAVRSSRKKPYAILIYTLSRFSRTGGNGISLANELVEKLGVHLYEVSTERNTFTEVGKLEVYQELLKARQENITRLSVTMPGLKKFVEEGNWLGKAPRGYDHYGHRTKNHKFYSQTQKIKINEEGKTLKLAWQWKLQGEKDHLIIEKLNNIGVSIKKQSLSDMWRNPFYCGISNHKLLDGEIVEGNWAKIVSRNDFLRVQEILKCSHQGYKQDKASPDRPLNGFIVCNECKGKMTGYENKKKGIHYYKCQNGCKSSINANKTIKAKADGAHELFLSLLSKYTLDPTIQDLFKEQLRLTYNTLNNGKDGEAKELKKELERAQNELKSLKKNYALGKDIDSDIYEELKVEFEKKIISLTEALEKVDSKISNLENYIDISLEVALNLRKYWASEELDIKKRIQELVFGTELSIDVKNRSYLTKNVNEIFQISAAINGVSGDEKEKRQLRNQLPSSLVAGTGLEPMTFGL